MDFEILQDIKVVMELLGMTTEEISDKIGISRMTLNNWLAGRKSVSFAGMTAFYKFAFQSGVRLNKIKEQLYKEEAKEDSAILFHGSKSGIKGNLSLDFSRENNDFGKGFYCGESLIQSAMFAAGFPESTLYMIDFCRSGLEAKEFFVDTEWMLTIAYFRGRLNGYENFPVVKEIRKRVECADYIIAPIADNKMFELIDQFIEGEITDEQCKHCLSATNLGNQYVFRTEKALKNIKILEQCFLTDEEKKGYLSERAESHKIGADKVKLAKKQYRNKGKYIEEVLE